MSHQNLKFDSLLADVTVIPVQAVGGRPPLKSLNGPLPDYLKLPNVICVGGSWMQSK